MFPAYVMRGCVLIRFIMQNEVGEVCEAKPAVENAATSKIAAMV